MYIYLPFTSLSSLSFFSRSFLACSSRSSFSRFSRSSLSLSSFSAFSFSELSISIKTLKIAYIPSITGSAVPQKTQNFPFPDLPHLTQFLSVFNYQHKYITIANTNIGQCCSRSCCRISYRC